MYGLSSAQVWPGISGGDRAAPHRQRKITPRRPRPILQSVSRSSGRKESVQYINKLEDGRFIAVAAQPMPGGGTVATHQDITEQRRSEAKIVHMAMHDTLTGLPNRVLLNDRIEHGLAPTTRGESMACHLLVLDYFKTVNDTLGHPAGDKLLCQVADRLRALVRETDTIARMGGDEFAILQGTLGQPQDAINLAHRVIDEISRPYDIDGQQVVIGTSVGIAIGPDDGSTPAELMRNADLALYRARARAATHSRSSSPRWTRACRPGGSLKPTCARRWRRESSSSTTSRSSICAAMRSPAWRR
jgi:diguanylate cyclase (GGDEF)-like protein